MTEHIGIIGLGVMGRNLALNMVDQGVSVAGYDRSAAARDLAAAAALQTVDSPQVLIARLPQPRRILLMVPAGAPVDGAISELQPLLARGDLLIDGGNSHFTDTARRTQALAAAGIDFLGLGVSGGEEGARKGPSLMVGGSRAAYSAVEPILTAIAARAADGAPCVALLGPRGAGHYVKMVHNGIEYGVMQLIAETYDLLHRSVGLEAAELHQLFHEWNQCELASFLMEITADIFTHIDAETGRPLLDLISDRAGQKGTGKWTSQHALDLGTAVPTLAAAVGSRHLSARKAEREEAAALYRFSPKTIEGGMAQLLEDARDTLYAATLCVYFQGMALLHAASRELDYQLNLATVASIWRAGCIIRAALLDHIAAAYDRHPDQPNLLLDEQLSETIRSREGAWRRVAGVAVTSGIPMPGTLAALSYFDSYRRRRLPANLIQAQRDYFGAHTFERLDRAGSFHHEWRRT